MEDGLPAAGNCQTTLPDSVDAFGVLFSAPSASQRLSYVCLYLMAGDANGLIS